MKHEDQTCVRIVKSGLALFLGLTLCACGALNLSASNWKEEVLLHDGQKIVVERSVERGGRHEIGQKPPFRSQRMRFAMPGTGEQIEWVDNFSEDIGTASFLPMLLDIQQGNAYLVANTMGCLSYNKWGRPNPPYVIFKHENKAWTRITLQELPVEIKAPNLIQSEPDATAERIKKNPVPAETIREIIARYPQPEYRSILREPLANGWKSCPKMISYGKQGGWIGLDWFTDQPSLEACINFCDRKKVSEETCPCNEIFKGK